MVSRSITSLLTGKAQLSTVQTGQHSNNSGLNRSPEVLCSWLTEYTSGSGKLLKTSHSSTFNNSKKNKGIKQQMYNSYPFLLTDIIKSLCLVTPKLFQRYFICRHCKMSAGL